MTLPSKHRIRNSNPGGLRPSTLPLGHGDSHYMIFKSGWGRNIFVSIKPPRPGNESQTLAWKAAVLTTTLGPRPAKLFKGWGVEYWIWLGGNESCQSWLHAINTLARYFVSGVVGSALKQSHFQLDKMRGSEILGRSSFSPVWLGKVHKAISNAE